MRRQPDRAEREGWTIKNFWSACAREQVGARRRRNGSRHRGNSGNSGESGRHAAAAYHAYRQCGIVAWRTARSERSGTVRETTSRSRHEERESYRMTWRSPPRRRYTVPVEDPSDVVDREVRGHQEGKAAREDPTGVIKGTKDGELTDFVSPIWGVDEASLRSDLRGRSALASSTLTMIRLIHCGEIRVVHARRDPYRRTLGCFLPDLIRFRSPPR